MNNFTHDDFSITNETTDNVVTMSWLGQCDFRDPARTLTPYLTRFIEDVTGYELIVHYQFLKFFNSSSVKVILQFITQLNAAGVKTIILYNAAVNWQKVTFIALGTFCRKKDFVTVQSIEA